MPRIIPADSAEFIAQVRGLFREYSTMPGVVACLDDFEREVASLPGAYGPPGGTLLLAVDDGAGNREAAVGCVALRKWEEGACEMKRLYVRPEFRGSGAGRALVKDLIAIARSMGYERMLLDTLPSMRPAHELYRSLGFREIAPYQTKPIHGALFFELVLRGIRDVAVGP
jgi:ribosomal protein S18 acetylase RimI-like enzyme